MATPSSAGKTGALSLALVLLAALGWWLLHTPETDAPLPGGAATGAPRPAPSDATAAQAEAAGLDRGSAESQRTAAEGATPPAPAERSEGAATRADRPVLVTVRGRVVDANNNGVDAAEVAVVERLDVPTAVGLPSSLAEQRGARTKTDARGAFAVPLHRLGAFELAATHSERPEARARGTAESTGVPDVIIVMREGGAISGSVIGAPADAGEIHIVAKRIAGTVEATARAASGALLDLGDFVDQFGAPTAARRTTVAADGTFALRGLDADVGYQVFGLRMPANAIPVRCTERVEVRPGAAGLQLRWRETMAITVRVVDADSGAPIEDLDVAVGPVHTMKVLGMSVPVPVRQPIPQKHFANGVVSIDGLGIDDGDGKKVSLELRAVGRRPWARDDIDAAVRGRLDLGVARLAAAPTVRVTVRDAAGPVAGARVRLVEKARAGAGDGEREPRGISFSTTVGTGDHEPAVTTSTDQDRTAATTGADGVAVATAEREGPTAVVVESQTHARWQGPIFDVPARGMVEQSALLVQGGVVRVTVRDGHGATVAGATVRRRAGDGDDSDSAKTDANGVALFPRLAPGEHDLSIGESDRASPVRVGISLGGKKQRRDETTVQITDGQSVEVELVIPLRGSLRGTVTLDGEPLDRAEVRVGDVGDPGAAEVTALVDSMFGGLAPGANPKARTDADGAFALDSVEAGERRLTITHKRLTMPAIVDVQIAEGDNRRDVALRATTVRGRVLRTDGTPVEGATISAMAKDVAIASGADLDEAAGILGELFGGGRSPVRTGADGTFELPGVLPGRELRVRASAKMLVGEAIDVPALQEGSVRDGVEFRLAAAGRVRVKATGTELASVVAEWAGGASPPIGGSSRHTVILKNGRATLDGLAPGPWRLHLEDDDGNGAGAGNPPRERTVTITAGATVDADL